MLPLTKTEDNLKYVSRVRGVLRDLWLNLEKEYISKLTYRRKNKEEHYYPIKEGDMVYIIGEQKVIPTSQTSFAGKQQSYIGRYKVGRVMQVQPGRDRIDRVYVIKHGPVPKKSFTNTKVSLFSSMNVIPVEDPATGM